MDNIKSSIEYFKNNINNNIKIVAVSKFHSEKEIMNAYSCGIKTFGENKVQELVSKYQNLPNDIQWHFIGTLQRNKVKHIAPFVSMIHSVDCEKLILEINKQAKLNNRIIPCLLQIHIAEEDTKHGFSEEECINFLQSKELEDCKNVIIQGVMGMATNSDNETKIRDEFRRLKNLFEKIKENYFNNKSYFKEISMGMSQDYKIALEEGSTIIRIGSLIFGNRI